MISSGHYHDNYCLMKVCISKHKNLKLNQKSKYPIFLINYQKYFYNQTLIY
jgi:hypothetical protein